MAAERRRLVVVGGGAGGLVVAAGAALFGVPVTLVEKRAGLGGDCLNFGCVPSKALIRAAKAAHELRTAGRFGLPQLDAPVDLASVMGSVDRAIAAIAPHDDPERFRRMGVEVLLGEPARFLSSGALRVGARELAARDVVIATGTRPVRPDVPGLDPARCWDSESLWEGLRELPGRLVVVGGGPIGCELGQAFARLGARVTIVQRAARLLSHEDPQAAETLLAVLRAESVDVRLASWPTRAVGDELVLADAHGGEAHVGFDAVLFAAGRRANVEALDLPAAGVALDPCGFVRVDAAMRTSRRGVWAVGDVAGPPLFTHVAEAEAKVVLRNVLFPFTGRMDYDVVPHATFTDPEIGQVGRTEEGLRAAGVRHDVHVFPLMDLDRAVTDGATSGFVKLLADPRGRLLGATVVAAHGGELVHELALAMRQGLSLSAISGLVHAYPTWSLANRRAADVHLRARLEGPAGRLLRWLAKR